MRRFFALLIVFTLWFGFAPTASADGVAGLTPCGETPAFIQKSKSYRNTTSDPNSGQIRAERYAQALCGPEGYPHLIVDGRWSHIGDFTIPGLMFLYIAGWIGWSGRSYLMTIRETDDSEMQEIMINVPIAISKMFAAAFWPLLATREIVKRKIYADKSEITVSPR
ncbi:MAG: Photosystem I reaction center subunit III [Cyanobacteria bacterium J06621_8]